MQRADHFLCHTSLTLQESESVRIAGMIGVGSLDYSPTRDTKGGNRLIQFYKRKSERGRPSSLDVLLRLSLLPVGQELWSEDLSPHEDSAMKEDPP